MMSLTYSLSQDDSQLQATQEDSPSAMFLFKDWLSNIRWSGGVGAMLTIGVHVAILALLMVSRETQQLEMAPINVAVISDQPQQTEALEPLRKPQLDTPKMHVAQPEIVLAEDTAPSTAPAAVSASVPASSPPAPAAATNITQPIFDADYLNNPAPSYPPLSRRMREQGTVLVRVLVSPEGLPDKIELKHSSGSVRLDEAALGVVKQWRFVPARQRGQTVAAWVVVPIAFSLTA